jgi:hypothetical protein
MSKKQKRKEKKRKEKKKKEVCRFTALNERKYKAKIENKAKK